MKLNQKITVEEAVDKKISKSNILYNYPNGLLELIYASKSKQQFVYKLYIDSSEIYILKIIECSNVQEINNAISEYELNNRVAKLTSYVVKPIDEYKFSPNNSTFEALYEYGGESLHSLKSKLNSQEVLRIMLGLIEPMIIMQSNCILHSDIKPANIVVNNGIPKIIDFGVSIEYEKSDEFHSFSIEPKGITKPYAPPEILNNEPFIPSKIDIYCWGMTLFQVLSRTNEKDLRDMIDLRTKDYKGFIKNIKKLKLKDCTDKRLSDIIKKILIFVLNDEPKKRPLFEELKEYIDYQREEMEKESKDQDAIEEKKKPKKQDKIDYKEKYKKKKKEYNELEEKYEKLKEKYKKLKETSIKEYEVIHC